MHYTETQAARLEALNLGETNKGDSTRKAQGMIHIWEGGKELAWVSEDAITMIGGREGKVSLSTFFQA